MKRSRFFALGVALVAPAFLLGPASAVGTVIGQTAPAGVAPCGPAFFVQSSDTGTQSYATTAGVITTWSMRNTTLNGSLKLKVVHPLSASTFSVTGSSELGTPAANTLSTFPTRIPVVAGDRLALYVPSATNAPCTFVSGAAGDTVNQAFGSLPDHGVGGVYTAGGSASNTRLNVSATVEPDADGDGYGDVTQDMCPGQAGATAECVAPDTAATGPKKVKTSRKTAKVTLLFLSEAGARFTCTIDKASPTPCSSPFKVKLKVGKHLIAVAASDAAGNTDPTPALLTIKVKRKKT